MIGLYAIVSAAPEPPVGTLRAVRAGSLVALVGAPPGPPTPDSLRAYDAAVRQIASAVDACLPARYGAHAADEAALVRELRDREDAFASALGLVRGREQMTLRIHGDAPSKPPPGAGGPGTRYLAQRRHAQTLPELDPLREALRPFVHAERLDRAHGLFASLYHLIDRGASAAYARAAGDARLDGLRVVVSGPWPAWCFTPEMSA